MDTHRLNVVIENMQIRAHTMKGGVALSRSNCMRILIVIKKAYNQDNGIIILLKEIKQMWPLMNMVAQQYMSQMICSVFDITYIGEETITIDETPYTCSDDTKKLIEQLDLGTLYMGLSQNHTIRVSEKPDTDLIKLTAVIKEHVSKIVGDSPFLIMKYVVDALHNYNPDLKIDIADKRNVG